MRLVDGLPLHPLIVHLPVVVIPLVATGLGVYALVPRWRRPLGFVLAALALAAAGASILAVWSGGQLSEALHHGEEVESHAELGQRTRAYAVVLAGAIAALVVYERRAKVATRVAGVAAAATVVAIGSTVAVAMTGHTGAKLAWQEEMAALPRVPASDGAPAREASQLAATSRPVAPVDPAAPAVPPGESAAAEPGVDVTLGEWALVSSLVEAPPGEVTFRFRNRGTVPHALRIRSAGSGKNRLEWRSPVVGPGEDGTITAALPAGSFELDCPVEDGHGEHDALGMETTFTVRPGAAPVTAPTTAPAPPPGGSVPSRPSPAPSPSGAIVDITGFAFVPAELRVARGATVRWRNADPAPHTATGDGWDTGRLRSGQDGSVTFDQAGTFSYLCVIHPAMTGTVTVS